MLKNTNKPNIKAILFFLFLPFLIACPDFNLNGGPPRAKAPEPPSPPIIVGPANVNLGNSYIYHLSSTDPQGSMVTYQTTTSGCTISNSILTFIPTDIGIIKITVIAENSFKLKSEKTEYSVTVSPPPAT